MSGHPNACKSSAGTVHLLITLKIRTKYAQIRLHVHFYFVLFYISTPP